MISRRDESKDFPMSLLPHQSAFLETFFNPASKRVVVLRGDVGLGKSVTLVALAGEVLKKKPAARVLFVVPAALRAMFVEKLRDAGCATLLVDRYRFREMLDAITEKEIWPAGMAAVLSQDFAKQPDIRDSLAGVHWGLVAADEAHQFRGARAEILHKVGASADRIVLATAIPVDDAQFDIFPPKDTTVVEWRRDQVVDQQGKPLDAGIRPTLHEITFSVSEAELNLRDTVGGLCEILGGAAGAQSLRAKTLLRSLESSPAALERSLQRLKEGAEALEELYELSDGPETEASDDKSTILLDGAQTEQIAGRVANALQQIEEIDSDSKLGAFGTLLEDLNDAKMSLKRICVFTQYFGTLYYLAAELEGRGLECQLLHGGMATEDRLRSLTLFSNAGKILIATTAIMMEGINLAEVTDLILYDIPGSKMVLQQIIGRFDPVGRINQLNVHVFVRSKDFSDLIDTPLLLLRDLLQVRTEKGSD